MKHKNVLLVVFFLTLFVFQQVQAGASLSSADRPSEINAPLANPVLFSVIKIRILSVDNSGAVTNPPILCKWPDSKNGPLPNGNGCPINEPKITGIPLGNTTYDCSQKIDPPVAAPGDDGNGKFYYLCADHDYLPDVVAKEMNVAVIPPHDEALKAQAVASRTVASWKAVHSTPDGIIDNSTTFQAYEPGSSSISGYDNQIRDAVNGTAGEFLQHFYCEPNNPNICYHAIDAEFSNDLSGQHQAPDGTVMTVSGNTGNAPYLESVEDPISNSGCGRPSVLGHGSGMVQLGAIRWAKGNTCPDGTVTDWPVSGTTSPIKWDYKQILAHYYTGVEFN